jgi:hypothetical protein
VSVGQTLLVLLAGICAGVINTVVGSGTLITFPALLAVGLPPVTANVSNTVGLFPGSFVGAYGYRRELADQRARVLSLGVASLLGGVLGAVLLLTLPAAAFKDVVPALIVLALLVCLAFAALGAFVGLRSGSGETVQGFFPLFFVLLFLSSMSLPRNLIEQDWFRFIATYNPVSYLIEGIRSFIITGWDGEALALGFGIAAVVAVGAVVAASSALRTRLVRT